MDSTSPANDPGLPAAAPPLDLLAEAAAAATGAPAALVALVRNADWTLLSRFGLSEQACAAAQALAAVHGERTFRVGAFHLCGSAEAGGPGPGAACRVLVFDTAIRAIPAPHLLVLRILARHAACELRHSAGPAVPESEDRFRQVVEGTPNAIIVVDSRGRIDLLNNEAERLFGYTRGQLLGQPVEMLIPKRFASNHPAKRDGFLSAPAARPMGAGRDLFGLRADGTAVPIEIGLNPIKTPAGTYVLASIVDITERKRAAQELEKALAEKTVLLDEIHHRVKNNLQIISGLLQLQASQAKLSALSDLLAQSQSRVQSMSLIHQLLYETGEYSRIKLDQYLRRLATLLLSSHSLNIGKITLTTNLAPVTLDLKRAIPCGLLVNELLTNAFKHAFPGDATGSLRLDLQRSEDGEHVLITVSDSGIGLPADLDLSKVRSLGLTLATQLASQIGAALHIIPTAGACFQFSFAINPEEIAT